MDPNYKQAKEGFVSGTTGSSITHVNLISLVALSAVSLYAAIRTRISPTRQIGFFASWTILVLPMLLSMTIAANHPLYLNILLLIPTAVVLSYPKAEIGTPLPSSQPPSPAVPAGASIFARVNGEGGRGRERERTRARVPPLPALTTYRAHMMLMTVLAILAVDFPVFPRSLAKCETFGASLMDLGVGSFVFSQGIVSAIPLVRDASYLQAPMLPKLIKVTRKSLPIIALGLLRVLLVKGTEYPEHVTEYGVHWNFFLTLAVLPVLQVIAHPLLVKFPISSVGVLVAVAQHVALTRFNLKEYVLSVPRTSSWVSMNKEGLVSLLGYLSIQLLGLSAGTLILPPTPSFFRRKQQALAKRGTSASASASVSAGAAKRRPSDPSAPPPIPAAPGKTSESETDLSLSAPRQLDKTATELCAYAILWWSLLGVVRFGGVDGQWSRGEGVSRRMVNISYILWVAAFNVTFILLYIVVLHMGIFGPAASQSQSQSKHRNLRGKMGTSTRSRTGTGTMEAEADASASASAYFGIASSPGVGASRLALHTPPIQRTYDTSGNGNPPALLEVVNNYGLGVFLLANVLTGLINLSLPTMYMSDGSALLLLSVYSLVCCGVPWVWDRYRRRRGVGVGFGFGSGFGSGFGRDGEGKVKYS